MARRLPPLNALRAFDAAGRHESFTRAAEELNVSHSAISRHVRGLEARLGVKLFRDLPRGVELTPAGRSYLERILPALDVISEATDGLAETPRGQVTVNSEPLFAERFILPRLKGFRLAYPDVEVRLEASTHLADVERYEADLAIRFARTGALDVPCELLSDAPIRVYAAPDLVREIRSPADLLAVPRLRDRSNNIWPQWFAAAGLDVDSSLDDGWRMTSALAYQAALNGLGVFLGSSECAAFDVTQGRLVQCFESEVSLGAFYLVHGPRGTRNAAVRQLRTWLLEVTRPFRQNAGPDENQPIG